MSLLRLLSPATFIYCGVNEVHLYASIVNTSYPRICVDRQHLTHRGEDIVRATYIQLVLAKHRITWLNLTNRYAVEPKHWISSVQCGSPTQDRHLQYGRVDIRRWILRISWPLWRRTYRSGTFPVLPWGFWSSNQDIPTARIRDNLSNSKLALPVQ